MRVQSSSCTPLPSSDTNLGCCVLELDDPQGFAGDHESRSGAYKQSRRTAHTVAIRPEGATLKREANYLKLNNNLYNPAADGRCSFCRFYPWVRQLALSDDQRRKTATNSK